MILGFDLFRLFYLLLAFLFSQLFLLLLFSFFLLSRGLSLLLNSSPVLFLDLFIWVGFALLFFFLFFIYPLLSHVRFDLNRYLRLIFRQNSRVIVAEHRRIVRIAEFVILGFGSYLRIVLLGCLLDLKNTWAFVKLIFFVAFFYLSLKLHLAILMLGADIRAWLFWWLFWGKDFLISGSKLAIYYANFSSLAWLFVKYCLSLVRQAYHWRHFCTLANIKTHSSI